MKLYDVEIKFMDDGKPYEDDGTMCWLIQADSSSDAIRSVFEVFDSADREFYQINIKENTHIKQIVLEKDRKAFDKFKNQTSTSEQAKARIKAAEDDVHECGPAC